MLSAKQPSEKLTSHRYITDCGKLPETVDMNSAAKYHNNR